jgi:hypothetical protein
MRLRVRLYERTEDDESIGTAHTEERTNAARQVAGACAYVPRRRVTVSGA